MRSLKKFGILLGLFVMMSFQTVFGVHFRSNSNHRLPCPIYIDVSSQITNPWHEISSILNVLYAQYATDGINPATLSLTAAYNDGLIAPEAQSFGDILIILGVNPKDALNASFQLNAYAVVSENYAIAVFSGGNISEALNNLNNQKKNLISALAALPKVKKDIVCSFLKKYQKNMIASIQAYVGKNFPLAVAEHQQGQNFNDDLASYLSITQLNCRF